MCSCPKPHDKRSTFNLLLMFMLKGVRSRPIIAMTPDLECIQPAGRESEPRIDLYGKTDFIFLQFCPLPLFLRFFLLF